MSSVIASIETPLKSPSQTSVPLGDPPAIELGMPLRAQPGRRLVAAWVYDFLPYYWISVFLVQLLSYVLDASLVQKLPLMVPAMCLFLMRDYFFEGRGIGKNFLGLRVIDAKTGGAPTLKQSITRNFLFVGPYLIYQFIAFACFLYPFQHAASVLAVVKVITQAWTILLLPVEGFLMHKGDGRRLADKLSGTKVIFQRHDFSNPFSLKRLG